MATNTYINGQAVSIGGAVTTAAAFTTSGANALTLTTTGSTNVTLPTTGTLAAASGLFASTADAGPSNTVTETSIIGTGQGSMTLAANYFTAGKTCSIAVRGYYTALNGSQTVRVKVYAGSTVLLDSGAIAVAAGASNPRLFNVDAMITCRTTGASGTVMCQGYYWDGRQTTVSFPNLDSTGSGNHSNSTITLDTTATQALDVKVTWGGADASNVVKGTNVILKTEYP